MIEDGLLCHERMKAKLLQYSQNNNKPIVKPFMMIVCQDVERAENAPATKNDILAKRFGIPMEGFTYFFTYEETKKHRRHSYSFPFYNPDFFARRSIELIDE